MYIKSSLAKFTGLFALLFTLSQFVAAQAVFTLTFPAKHSTTPLDGRLLLLFSKDTTGEPRFQVRDDYRSAQVFGLDVEGWLPGKPLMFKGDVTGHPLRALADLPPGTYTVQALLHRYETCRWTGEKASNGTGHRAICIQNQLK
jgi:hypothetical protein